MYQFVKSLNDTQTSHYLVEGNYKNIFKAVISSIFHEGMPLPSVLSSYVIVPHNKINSS